MSDQISIPVSPPRALLISMALRFNHAFGMPKTEVFPGFTQGFTKAEREALLISMSQIYDEVAGQGFYKWDGSTDKSYQSLMEQP